MRAQRASPLWKLVRSYFSFGECTRSSSSPKPTSRVSRPSVRLKSPTIGIEPPEPMVTGLAAPFVRQRGLGARSSAGHVVGELDRARALVRDELDRAIGRNARAHERFEAPRRSSPGPGRRRGGTRSWPRLAGDHGLRALARIAADDAVDVAGRARLDLLDQHAALLAGRNACRPTWPRKSSAVRSSFRHCSSTCGRRLGHAVVEVRDA